MAINPASCISQEILLATSTKDGGLQQIKQHVFQTVLFGESNIETRKLIENNIFNHKSDAEARRLMYRLCVPYYAQNILPGVEWSTLCAIGKAVWERRSKLMCLCLFALITSELLCCCLTCTDS